MTSLLSFPGFSCHLIQLHLPPAPFCRRGKPGHCLVKSQPWFLHTAIWGHGGTVPSFRVTSFGPVSSSPGLLISLAESCAASWPRGLGCPWTCWPCLVGQLGWWPGWHCGRAWARLLLDHRVWPAGVATEPPGRSGLVLGAGTPRPLTLAPEGARGRG